MLNKYVLNSRLFIRYYWRVTNESSHLKGYDGEGDEGLHGSIVQFTGYGTLIILHWYTHAPHTSALSMIIAVFPIFAPSVTLQRRAVSHKTNKTFPDTSCLELELWSVLFHGIIDDRLGSASKIVNLWSYTVWNAKVNNESVQSIKRAGLEFYGRYRLKINTRMGCKKFTAHYKDYSIRQAFQGGNRGLAKRASFCSWVKPNSLL